MIPSEVNQDRPANVVARLRKPPLVAQGLSQLPSDELYASLKPSVRSGTMDFIDWLLRKPRTSMSTQEVVTQLCARLIQIGLPLDRYGSSTTILTAEHDGIGRVWTRGEGVKENVYISPTADDPDYLNSPLFEAARTGRWIELWLPETPDERFGIVRELKEAGFTHYVCMPIPLTNDAQGWITVATKAPSGFSREDVTVLALITPAISILINTRVAWMTLDRLLRTYVGDEPHRAILAGNVKRGQVTTIRSAILFADMRDSTGHTAEISAVQAVELFNNFFDCLVPPIEQRGGEVLKYIGDGLLAIFRDVKSEPNNAATRALAAGEELIERVRAFTETRPAERPVEVGVALHFGEAAYGNVGSGIRLDFTVIGRDIGLASRIGGLNARLGEPLLMSAAFVGKLGRDATPLGAFAVRGFSAPVAVYRPDQEVAEHDD